MLLPPPLPHLICVYCHYKHNPYAPGLAEGPPAWPRPQGNLRGAWHFRQHCNIAGCLLWQWTPFTKAVHRYSLSASWPHCWHSNTVGALTLPHLTAMHRHGCSCLYCFSNNKRATLGPGATGCSCAVPEEAATELRVVLVDDSNGCAGGCGGGVCVCGAAETS